MVMGQILGELEAGELIAGGYSSHDASSFQIGEMAVGGAPRHVGNGPGDIGDAHGAPK